jgi:hypothetical protein
MLLLDLYVRALCTYAQALLCTHFILLCYFLISMLLLDLYVRALCTASYAQALYYVPIYITMLLLDLYEPSLCGTSHFMLLLNLYAPCDFILICSSLVILY